jgi:hypothetical protein
MFLMAASGMETENASPEIFSRTEMFWKATNGLLRLSWLPQPKVTTTTRRRRWGRWKSGFGRERERMSERKRERKRERRRERGREGGREWEREGEGERGRERERTETEEEGD